jgi:hypothetical protein
MLHLPAGETIAAWHPKTERRRTKVNFIILILISYKTHEINTLKIFLVYCTTKPNNKIRYHCPSKHDKKVCGVAHTVAHGFGARGPGFDILTQTQMAFMEKTLISLLSDNILKNEFIV